MFNKLQILREIEYCSTEFEPFHRSFPPPNTYIRSELPAHADGLFSWLSHLMDSLPFKA